VAVAREAVLAHAAVRHRPVVERARRVHVAVLPDVATRV
jgi:hypothetical protein